MFDVTGTTVTTPLFSLAATTFAPSLLTLTAALTDTAGTAKWSEGDAFSGVEQSLDYWSSTSVAGAATHAWHVDFLSGQTDADDKDLGRFVWPVRAGS